MPVLPLNICTVGVEAPVLILACFPSFLPTCCKERIVQATILNMLNKKRPNKLRVTLVSNSRHPEMQTPHFSGFAGTIMLEREIVSEVLQASDPDPAVHFLSKLSLALD